MTETWELTVKHVKKAPGFTNGDRCPLAQLAKEKLKGDVLAGIETIRVYDTSREMYDVMGKISPEYTFEDYAADRKDAETADAETVLRRFTYTPISDIWKP